MYASIRMFRSIRSIRDQVTQRVESDLVPKLKQTPGLKSYQIVDAGDGRAASIVFYDNREAAVAGNEKALAWIRQNLSEYYDGEPEALVGEVIISS